MYRKADSQDIPAISRIFIDSWQSNYKAFLSGEVLASLTYEWADKYFADYFAEKDHGGFVATNDEGHVTAFVTYMPYTDKIPDCIFLDSLHVAPSDQGKGVGKTLIAMVGKYAYEKGYKKMALSMLVGNTRAESIYLHLGARHLKDYTDYLEDFAYEGRMLIWDDISVFARQL